MFSPVISVILCVRNGETYLKQALDSVALQKMVGIEVIVIDDGSDDRSARIASEHMIGPRVERQPPLGHGAALNRGLQRASGRFIACIDADDVWPAGRLVALLGVFERSSCIDIVFGATQNTDAELRPLQNSIPNRMPNAALIRHTSALRVGDFRVDVKHGTTVDWISRAVKLGLKFAEVDAVVLFRRIHDNNLGIRDRERGRQDMLRVIRDHHARTREP